MYTELHLNVELVENLPKEVVAVLRYMVHCGRDPEEKPDVLPDHPLFGTERWEFMLTCDSYYFSADTRSTMRLDEISGTYFLCVQCNVKNYDGEIAAFIDWLTPYIDPHENFVGYWRYEEADDPTLIYLRKKEGKDA